MKENDELTWKEIFKNFFLIRTVIPLVLTIIYGLIIGNKQSSGNELIISLGVILIIGTVLGFLTFLNIVVKKIFKTKRKNKE